MNTVYSPKNTVGNTTVPLWNPEIFDTQKSLIKNLVQYNNLYYATQKAKPSVSVGNFALPLNLKLTLDGISGMKILQQFLVNSKFLPAGYDDNLIYLLINISHKVDNNTWITELDTIFVPKNPEVAPAEAQPFNDLDNPVTQTILGETISNNDPTLRPFYSYSPSTNGFNFIVSKEGLRKKAYKDIKGVWTIGYGSTRFRPGVVVPGQTPILPAGGRRVREGDVITQEYAYALFKADIDAFAQRLNASIGELRVTQNQYDALISFSYNVGTAWATESNLRTQLFRANKGEISYNEASNAFLEWNKTSKKDKKTGKTIVTISNGLTNRRRAEQALFNLITPE